MPAFLHTAFISLRTWPRLHLLLTGIAPATWVIGLVILIRYRSHYRRLADLPLSPEELEAVPSLTVIVPACNEAETIERGMRSLIALNYPCLEIIAVDDRSTDATGAILDRLAAEDARLRILHVTELPPGWLGKNHALQIASEQATGEWLLFTDADVVFAPETMRRAVAYACRRRLDHLVLSPECETRGFWERLFVSYFGLMFSFRVRPWEVADPRKSAYVGLGVFNMVRAAAYRAFGGHRALPMDVTDDMKLGKIVKRNGYRQEILQGGDLISVRWLIGFHGIIEGLMKNAFAGFEFRLLPMLGAILGLALTALYPVFALFVPIWPGRVLAAAALLAMAWGAGAMRRVSGASAWYGLAYPLAGLILIYIILRSTWRAYRQNGIVWRGTRYPLDELKRGVV